MRVLMAALMVLAIPAIAIAQTANPTPSAKNLDSQPYQPQLQSPCVTQADGRTCIAVSATNPLPVSGGGGGGGGDASAANQTTQIAAANLTNTRLGDTASPAAGTVNARLEQMRALLASTLTFNLPSGAATSALQTTGNTSLATIAGPVGTPGSATPSTAGVVAGGDPSGNVRRLATDTAGRLLPAQGIVASTRTTLTASTATQIAAAASARIGLVVTTEAALTAPVYICTTQGASCSATNYDFLLPNGATAGASTIPLFAPNGAITAFSSGTPVIVVNSWTAQ